MIEAVGCKLRISAQRGPKIARRTVSGYVGSTRSSVIDGEMRRERRRRYASRARYCTERASVPVSRIWSLPRDLRSSSDGVLAQNFAESVDSLDLHRGIKWLGRDVGDRDLEIDPAMRPSCVVMLDELGEHAFEVTRVSDEQPIEALATGGANESLGEYVARGARTGVLMTRAPMLRMISSKGPTNLASRSRIKNLTKRPSSSSVIVRLRACWVLTQLPIGCSVTPAKK